MTRVKICGITSVSDAKAAVDFGADALGLIFANSPRQVSVREAVKICRSLSPWTSVVGVFVNEKPQRMLSIARECGFSTLQLHGQEEPAILSGLKPLKVVKVLHVDQDFKAQKIKRYSSADAILLDTRIADQLGGTGKVFDWKALKKIDFIKPLIVSGGLNPENVAEAIRCFRPYGVDVSSGVEKSPGKKDLIKMKRFIQNAKKA